MSFEMSVALAGKLLKIRDSNNSRVDSAKAAVAKAHEKIPDIDPKLLNLRKDLTTVKEIQTGSRKDVPEKMAELMGVKKTRPVTRKKPPAKLFK